jgi:hypothetical protein
VALPVVARARQPTVPVVGFLTTRSAEPICYLVSLKNHACALLTSECSAVAKKHSTTFRPREQIFDGRGQEAASRYTPNPGVESPR